MMTMKCRMLSDFIFVLLIMAYYCQADTSNERLNVKEYLKRFNKHALKSIKSPDGDIIDCVDISKQPAFDHPSLKNHTIQMIPNYHPEGLFTESKKPYLKFRKNDTNTITQLWHNSGRCPEGTIPIRRTKEEDVLRSSSIKSYGKKNLTTVSKPKFADVELINKHEHQYAIAYVSGGRYFGATAIINVWKPQVQQPEEFSLSQVWIHDGPYSDLNTVEAGWTVYPHMFGDHNPRLFTYWTSDGYKKTGCYNLACYGFIQISNKIALGASISPISKYQGRQYQINILVWKDPKGGNWWMKIGDIIVGYWPASLFSYLKGSASMVQWGGEVVNLKIGGHHTTTQMGSGHFPGERYGKASFFNNLQVVDSSNQLRVAENLRAQAEHPNCYNVQLGRSKSKSWGSYFFYGGPGRNPKCP